MQKDLFEYYNEQPPELKKVLSNWSKKINNGLDYNQCDELLKEVESIGYTFDYELSAEPFNLRKIKRLDIGQKLMEEQRRKNNKKFQRAKMLEQKYGRL